jgi:HK97 family phage portal protein
LGPLDWLETRLGMKAVTATPAFLEALHARQVSPFPALGGTNLTNRRVDAAVVEVQNQAYGWLYRHTPAVHRVVDFIAWNVSQLGLKVYERVDDDDRRQVGDHAAARSLRRPNPHTHGRRFVFNFVGSFLIWDNAYALKFPRNGQRLLVGLSPSHVGIIGRSFYEIEGYRIYRADGSSFDVRPEDVIHWRGHNPDDPRRGDSKLETLRQEIATDTALRTAVTELMRNGLSQPGWIERPLEAPEWSDEAQERFEEDWAARSKANVRRTPVLEEGMVFKTGGVTPEDAQVLAARTWTNEQVASLYGLKDVPPVSEEARRQFYSDGLAPLCADLADCLTLQLLEDEYLETDLYFEFNLDEKLMGDDRLKALTSAAGAPILTRNEARARLNLPAKEDGDELITPLNVVVGGKPSPQAMPIQKPGGPSQEGDERSGEAEQPEAAGARSLNGHRKQLLIPRQVRQDARRDRWGAEYGEVVGGHFARQERVIKSRKARAKAATDDRWNDELAVDLRDVSQRHFAAEGLQAAFRMASEFDPARGANWLEEKAKGTARAINRVTQEQIGALGVASAFEAAREIRAPAAGMAYATDVAGFAVRAAIQQTPDADRREVEIAGGECPICAEFQGVHTYADVPAWPAYHPNCDCIADPR